MSPTPARARPPTPRPMGRLLTATAGRIRQLPTQRKIARRHVMIKLTKWLLPAGALALLGLIAMWPEFDRATEQGRLAFRRMSGNVDGAEVTDARYRGVDERGRPYTITASLAEQMGPERVDLTDPKGDITQENGTWLMLQSKQGVYMQHASQLDLSRDVVLYRDDGMTVRTNSASIDLKSGAASGAEPVSVEGPLGTLNAPGFTVLDKGAVMQFPGPARLVMNARGG